MHSPTLYSASTTEQWTLPCQLGINTFKLAIVTTKVEVIALQMVSHLILSVSPSSSSMSRESKRSEQYETKTLSLGKFHVRVAVLPAHIASNVYAYIATYGIATLNYETQNVNLQSLRVLKVNIIPPLSRLSSFSVSTYWAAWQAEEKQRVQR